MDRIFETIWLKKFAFVGTFFIVFTFSYIFLLAIDFLPEKPVADSSDPNSEQQVAVDDSLVSGEEDSSIEGTEEITEENDNYDSNTYVKPEFPTKITIEKLDKTISVANPTSRSIADLDTALLDGVVRHPDSASLTQEGNVFILGHSSYLPKVFNKNFQAFNGIQDLVWGDIIKVYSEDSVFEYRVEKVYRANAQDVTVPIAGEGHRLTLATCNSFGSVDDRYIVEAKQISIQSL
ncbi:sortase [Candidatus Nomurabacteria bacterium]|nr:sortase [Candidatus Kaiserbacteria bacterium]MCB9815050.1 sortase [Candidatus Nomurabacteria bacterium]